MMMIGLLGETGAGAGIVVLTLRDVFDTVVVPGESTATLRVERRLVMLLLPVWRRCRRRQAGLSTSFAPSVLLATFIVWMVLLLTGFSLIAHALGNSFTPEADFGRALFIAGSALSTIGLSGIEAHGAARWLLIAAGLSGLSVLTMAVTYLLEVQQGMSRRDSGVLKLTTIAGEPPSALRLLQRFAELDCRQEIERLLHESRDWCIAVQRSHTSRPSLIYFRSVGTATGWPATLGTMMDLALIYEFVLDERGSREPAVLLQEQGLRLIEGVCVLVGLKPGTEATSEADVQKLCQCLRQSGYPVRSEVNSAEFVKRRTAHARGIQALSSHLGAPTAPLLQGEVNFPVRLP
jgi:hypothetical protein